MKVITKLGYSFDVEDASGIKVGHSTRVPKITPDSVEYVSPDTLRFLAQFYGSRKVKWSPMVHEMYGVGGEHLPEYLFHLSDEQLWEFFKYLYSKTGILFRHRSNTSDDSGEVWMFAQTEELAKDFRTLLWQLDIRVRIWYHPQRKMWLVASSGVQSYILLRPMLKATMNPRIKKRLPEMDSLISFQAHHVEDHGLFDVVRELIDG